MEEGLTELLVRFAAKGGRLMVLTGAGISAESGIPTFRGKEGYWRVGSRNYHPQEMATHAMFERHPEAVWRWYLHRREICRQARPNAGHRAVAALERILQDRFLLITQNVDGLHLEAGNTPERTYEIHGNIRFMRCARDCHTGIYPIPDSVRAPDPKAPFPAEVREALRCPRCGAMSRPHVLWFDECYDERYYHLESSLEGARCTDFLLIVGTSGATNLPHQITRIARAAGATIVDLNLERNFLTPYATFLQGKSSEVLPEIAMFLEKYSGEVPDSMREKGTMIRPGFTDPGSKATSKTRRGE
ncbi:MAG: RNA polymerase subunit sigma [Deltaproteobacteria bacterium]|nr:MAG: RNA polymerase subunit sigma [Deltaproteobacteria bacterium]